MKIFICFNENTFNTLLNFTKKTDEKIKYMKEKNNLILDFFRLENLKLPKNIPNTEISKKNKQTKERNRL